MEHQVLEFRDIVRMLSRHKLVVTVLLATCLAGSIVYTLTAPKRYVASSRLLILPVVPGSPLRSSGAPTPGGSLGLDMDPSTQAQVVGSSLIAARVAKSLKLNTTLSDLVSMVNVQAGETQILEVDATAASPDLAAALANGFARQYVLYRREFTATTLGALARNTRARMAQLQIQIQEVEAEIERLRAPLSSSGNVSGQPESSQRRRLDDLTTRRDNLADQLTSLRQRASDLRSSAESVRGGAGQVIQRAVSPVAPTRPKAMRDIPVGLLAGLLLAPVLAFLLEYFDDRIRSGSDVESRTGTSVLAVVPKLGLLERLRSRGSVLKNGENGAAVNAFRRLRARLLAHGTASRGGVLVVASLYDGEESAVIVARLAVALARANFRTLLISLDVRHHRMEKLLQIQCDRGLTDILMDDRPLLSVVTATDHANLSLIPAGSGTVEDTDLFASTRLRHVLDEGGQIADIVLVEAPLGSTSADLAVLASQADGSLLVARTGSTRHCEVRAALRELSAVGASVLGVVVADKVRRRGAGQHVSQQPRAARLLSARSRLARSSPDRASLENRDAPVGGKP